MKLYLYIEETREGGQGSDEPYSVRDNTYIEMDISQVSTTRTENGFFPPTHVEIPEELTNVKVLYLPVVRYRDGDTYHSTIGLYEIGPVFGSLEEAKEWDPDTLPRRPWSGYFSGDHWSEIEYWRLNLNEGASSPCKVHFKYYSHD